MPTIFSTYFHSVKRRFNTSTKSIKQCQPTQADLGGHSLPMLHFLHVKDHSGSSYYRPNEISRLV